MTPHLLAFLDRPETARLVLDAAAVAAGIAGAEITAFAIRHAPEEGLMPTEEVAGPAALARRAAEEESRIAALRAAFEAWGHPAVRFEEAQGTAEAAIKTLAGESEVLLLGHAPGAERDATQTLDVALFSAHLPTLFVPQGTGGAFGGVIAIAWKPDGAAARAVASAMPWLSRATQIVVLTVDEGEAVAPPDLAALEAQGVPVTHRTVPGEGRGVGEALLAEAHAAGADMLVMGAFTHARWREILLGGATRAILRDADLPVLMQH